MRVCIEVIGLYEPHDLPGKNPATRLSLSALKPRDARIDDGAFVDWHAKVRGMATRCRWSRP